MNVLDFSSKIFNDIPEQDNPTFQTTNYTGKRLRLQECIMICKVRNPRHSGVGDGFVVIHVPTRGEIVSKGRFWKLDMAMVFADSISNLIMHYDD